VNSNRFGFGAADIGILSGTGCLSMTARCCRIIRRCRESKEAAVDEPLRRELRSVALRSHVAWVSCATAYGAAGSAMPSSWLCCATCPSPLSDSEKSVFAEKA
jgi:hypothetical protein